MTELPSDLHKIYESLIDKKTKLTNALGQVIVGQEETIHLLLISLISKGHSMFVGVPGLAKTTLINTLCSAIDLKFSRIQFTPDLMPADITGSEIIQQDALSAARNFEFIKGPLFANIVLADEINRASPKTQSALLQAMQEYQVTVSGKTYHLGPPFFIFATQNPIEQEGTFPLPEAQLDRFMMQINISYQPKEEEIEILKRTTLGELPSISPVANQHDIIDFQKLVYNMPVSDIIYDYAIELVRRTRPDDPACPSFIKDHLFWGASPRGAQNLILGAKANALLNDRYTISPEDVESVLFPVLRHRLILNYKAESEGISTDDIITYLARHFSL